MKNEEKQNQEVIDIESFGKEGKKVPRGKKYKIKVDRQVITVDKEELTGEEILTLAKKTPIKRYQLNQKLRGGEVKKIDYQETVDLTTPGIERFMTLPLDQTEG